MVKREEPERSRDTLAQKAGTLWLKTVTDIKLSVLDVCGCPENMAAGPRTDVQESCTSEVQAKCKHWIKPAAVAKLPSPVALCVSAAFSRLHVSCLCVCCCCRDDGEVAEEGERGFDSHVPGGSAAVSAGR